MIHGLLFNNGLFGTTDIESPITGKQSLFMVVQIKEINIGYFTLRGVNFPILM